MKIKKGDKVKVLAGKDRGKTGKVLQVLVAEQRASVEGINVTFKNMRSRKQGESGQRIQFPAPLTISNLGLICPKCGKVTRVGSLVNDDGTKHRICKKCKEVI